MASLALYFCLLTLLHACTVQAMNNSNNTNTTSQTSNPIFESDSQKYFYPLTNLINGEKPKQTFLKKTDPKDQDSTKHPRRTSCRPLSMFHIKEQNQKRKPAIKTAFEKGGSGLRPGLTEDLPANLTTYIADTSEPVHTDIINKSGQDLFNRRMLRNNLLLANAMTAHTVSFQSTYLHTSYSQSTSSWRVTDQTNDEVNNGINSEDKNKIKNPEGPFHNITCKNQAINKTIGTEEFQQLSQDCCICPHKLSWLDPQIACAQVSVQVQCVQSYLKQKRQRKLLCDLLDSPIAKKSVKPGKLQKTPSHLLPSKNPNQLPHIYKRSGHKDRIPSESRKEPTLFRQRPLDSPDSPKEPGLFTNPCTTQ